MKTVRPWIFLALYAIALCRPLAPFLEYEANRDFFAEVLCINKAKPELECNGQCALTQKLKQAFDDEAQPISAPATIKLDDYPIGFVVLLSPVLKGSCKQLESKLLSVITATLTGYLFEILRPPCHS